jgi:hypothetical protein
VFGALLGIGQELGFQRLILFRRRAAAAGASDGADGDLAIAQTDEDFRARAGQLEIAEIEERNISYTCSNSV